MKKHTLCLILLSTLLFANITYAQWTTSGSNIYYNSGNVGIGGTSVDDLLHLTNGTLRIEAPNGGELAGIKFYEGSTFVFHVNYNGLGAGSTGNKLEFASTWTSNILVLRGDGNVGIGTSSPATKLHVLGGDFRVTATDANGADIYAIGQDNKGVDLFAQSGKGHIKTDTDGMDLILGAGNWGWNGTSYDQQLVLKSGGNIGIGTATPQAILDVAGTTRTKVIQITGGADIAEPFNITGDISIEPGMVVSIDPDQIGQLRVSGQAYDRTVAGIISGAGGVNPGIVMAQTGSEADGEYPVALTGRVYAWADASNGPIKPGDLLTTSDTPGHAMKVSDYSRGRGAIIGKAMSRLEEGKGLVLVLISLQ